MNYRSVQFKQQPNFGAIDHTIGIRYGQEYGGGVSQEQPASSSQHALGKSN
jgi:hypothetical protein